MNGDIKRVHGFTSVDANRGRGGFVFPNCRHASPDAAPVMAACSRSWFDAILQPQLRELRRIRCLIRLPVGSTPTMRQRFICLPVVRKGEVEGLVSIMGLLAFG